MAYMFRVFILLAAVPPFCPLMAQSSPVHMGPGVTPPQIIQKVEPKYTAEATAAHIQGNVVVQLVVDEQGMPTKIAVLSPLGFGLDERALAAIETWRFRPGVKDNKPVAVAATIEVSFRFIGEPFDSTHERRRTDFNIAIKNLSNPNEKVVASAVETLRKLAHDKFAPAVGMLGIMLLSGDHVDKNPEEALGLLKKAADKHYGPALGELGALYVSGDHVERDVEKGLELMREGSLLGSLKAQYALGMRYETGVQVEKDVERSRRYYRLCAARGAAPCQLQLGKLLLDTDAVQGVAWLRLAADQGQSEARTLADAEQSKLTAEQVGWSKKLQSQLTRPPS